MDSESEFTEYSRAREESESLADPQDRVLAAYSRVWDEFYRWEPDACHEVLASLRRDTNSLHSLMEDIPPQNINHSGQDSTESDLCFISVTTGGPSTVMSIEETLAKSFAAHPPYEACTPISRNIIFREGDYDDAQECQFIPYADDPEFDSIKYLAHFAAGLAWDGFKSVHKPDIETIQLEAVRRLYLGQPSVPLHEINGCGILPKLFPDIGSGLRSGFLWETMQRDALTWPGASLSTLGALEWTRECSEFDLLSRMNAVTTHFCPNLNCVDAHCRTHTFDYPFITPKKATLNSINLFPTASNICGEDCFLNVLDYDIFKESVLWGDADIRALQAILAVTPDSSPCDLAVICRKPCNEVFVQRCLILPDETIYVPPIGDDPVESGLESDPLVFDDDDDGDARIAPIPPCSHEGPCDRRAKCPCFLSSLRCQRSCRCDLDCGRRFMGCNCRSSQPFTCESAKSCPCARVGRECDPELCMPCFSRKEMCQRDNPIGPLCKHNCQEWHIRHGPFCSRDNPKKRANRRIRGGHSLAALHGAQDPNSRLPKLELPIPPRRRRG
ncbi:hypothetical protein NEOLEDRAFT_84716 [Neolentinus lepideus HHB14362 ss-1]|uniref:CXC domain-containing protein n=1 Tax=Neolentinus lepideus HHB14362 ss-1 TaxID=1314782 RepID=A0A165MYE9_9AGAM|nr:hypothetical protein NEOLEDRAFT_84716 [Neolentinus lepideus HHB14362 ss-1]